MSQSEFDVIRRYFSFDAQLSAAHIKQSVGDDAAVLSIPADMDLVVAADTLVEGVHFPTQAPAQYLAERALAANLSDLAAMGAEPLSFTLALTLPSIDEHWLSHFSQALRQQARTHRIALVGGDLTRGPLCISMQLLGLVPRDQALKRQGAEPNQDVWVSGTLGDSAAGLHSLSHQFTSEVDKGYLQSRYWQPQPRLALGQALRNYANACIDISDGLAADLNHMLSASEFGAEVELADLPLSQVIRQAVSRQQAIDWALNGGEDFELCFIADAKHREDIALLSQRLALPLSRIGKTCDKLKHLRFKLNGQNYSVNVKGYQHF